jgi:hypothetical protein
MYRKENSIDYYNLKRIEPDSIFSFVGKTEEVKIVIASQKTDGITPNLYQQLLHLLESETLFENMLRMKVKHNAFLFNLCQGFFLFLSFQLRNQINLTLMLYVF